MKLLYRVTYNTYYKSKVECDRYYDKRVLRVNKYVACSNFDNIKSIVEEYEENCWNQEDYKFQKIEITEIVQVEVTLLIEKDEENE